MHTHPFQSLPLLRSHIHPSFTILKAGRKLNACTGAEVDELRQNYPILHKVLSIYDAWTAPVPEDAEDDPTWDPPDDDGNIPDAARSAQHTEYHRHVTRSKQRQPGNPLPQHPHERPNADDMMKAVKCGSENVLRDPKHHDQPIRHTLQ